jgi:hypothetical protein
MCSSSLSPSRLLSNKYIFIVKGIFIDNLNDIDVDMDLINKYINNVTALASRHRSHDVATAMG